MKKNMMTFLVAVTLVISAFSVAIPVKAAESSNDVVIYRIYNPNSGEHFYTKNSNEKDYLYSVGWNYEGIAWIAPITGDPVYRVYNPNSGEHHYTNNINEKDNLVRLGWNYENICWYTSSVEDECSAPLYRLYNPNTDAEHEAGSHHHTLSIAEKDNLVNLGWEYEGISWISTHNIEYHEGIYVDAYEYRGSQVYCNDCGEMIYDGWDHGTDFDSLEELMARHLIDKHGADIDIDYVDPARWKEFEGGDTLAEQLKAALEYGEYIAPRMEACRELQSHFTVDYEGSEYGFRPKKHIVEPGYAVCKVCDKVFYEK